jgi:hypothetical protein
MPASLYRLAGKPHHTEIRAEVSDPQIVEETAPEVTPVETSDVVAAITDEAAIPETPAQESPEPEEESVQENVAAPPVWEPTWTKTQLLAVAAQLNLPVTMENTKTEIIAALTAATSR